MPGQGPLHPPVKLDVCGGMSSLSLRHFQFCLGVTSAKVRHTRAIPFDMFQQAGGFGHRGEDCTFETLRKEFRIHDRRVVTIGQIIHDADLTDEKFGRMEGIGLDRVLIGWAQQGVSDEELFRRGMEMIEGLYNSFLEGEQE